MFILTVILFISVFLICAITDILRREIPDVLTSLLLILLIWLSPHQIEIAFICFSLLFGVNALMAHFNIRPILAWGDILLFPSYAAFIFSISTTMFWFPIASLAILASIFVISVLKKEHDPPVGSWVFWSVYIPLVIGLAISKSVL